MLPLGMGAMPITPHLEIPAALLQAGKPANFTARQLAETGPVLSQHPHPLPPWPVSPYLEGEQWLVGKWPGLLCCELHKKIPCVGSLLGPENLSQSPKQQLPLSLSLKEGLHLRLLSEHLRSPSSRRKGLDGGVWWNGARTLQSKRLG